MKLFKLKLHFVVIYFSLVLINQSCAQKEEYMHTNHLINESSPYLLQHAHNPVDWYPWGDEALKKAKDENKLLIISIGYSSCHWCHVMEHESFEDSAVAKLMNDKYVSIKVDREERPDIDQIYMEAAQLITGSGGWPLNAIALPDGRPIYAGTYFPKDQWMGMLQKVNQFYREAPEKALEQAQKLTEGISQVEAGIESSNVSDYSSDDLHKIINNWMPKMDLIWGGQDKAPKFPMPVGLEFLMEFQHFEGDLKVRNALEVSLDRMAMGGIYDAVGGGFARYSTDEYWKVPHFEKMLYDNGQLVSLYSHAYQVFKKPLYKDVVIESLEFMKREMTGKEGQFFSALDADTEREEGKFYVWTKEEWEEVLAEDSELFSDVFNIEKKGNWEHGNNVLFRKMPWKSFADKHGLEENELKAKWNLAKIKLLKKRDTRVSPGLDDKALTAWNALMLKGYIDAYRAIGDPHYLEVAIKNAEFLKNNMVQKNGSLLRNYKDGKAVINAFLDDYALLTDAYISLYEASFDQQWLNLAKSLTDHAIEKFSDSGNPLFFYTSSNDTELIARKKDVPDNVIASSNSTMANNLYVLSKYFDDKSYLVRSEAMLSYVRDDLSKYWIYYSNWSRLLLKLNYGAIELAIVGNDLQEFRKEFDAEYLPNTLFMGSKSESSLPLLENKFIEGQTTIFVCRNKVCDLPVTEVSQALNQIRSIQIQH